MPFDEYELFLKQNGVKTLYYNNDKLLVLPCEKAAEAVKLFENNNFIIIGGDVYVNDKNGIEHIFITLGQEYHCFDWYYDGSDRENSINIAKTAVNTAYKATKSLNKNCYIALYYN